MRVDGTGRVAGLTNRVLLQSVEDITRIVEEARKPPTGLTDWDNDEFLDGAMNQEAYGGSSFDEWGECC